MLQGKIRESILRKGKEITRLELYASRLSGAWATVDNLAPEFKGTDREIGVWLEVACEQIDKAINQIKYNIKHAQNNRKLLEDSDI